VLKLSPALIVENKSRMKEPSIGEIYRKPSSSRPERQHALFKRGKFGIVRSYPPGYELLQQGSPAEAVYLIHDGIVKLVWNEPKGKESIVGLRWQGWFLAAPSIISDTPCPTSAITLTRSKIEHIPPETFLDRLQRDPNLGWELHQNQSREICEQFRWLGELACCSARSRLLYLLDRWNTSNGTGSGTRNLRLRLPLKRKDIADLIAVTPEHLSRLLSQLSREGQIDLTGGWIAIAVGKRLGTRSTAKSAHSS
jgi:CRP-like cAMP-binding protein